MIEIPKQYTMPFIATKTSGQAASSNGISDQENPAPFIERRLSPTRRRPQDSKTQIERRVSSDRRRPSFSSKA